MKISAIKKRTWIYLAIGGALGGGFGTGVLVSSLSAMRGTSFILGFLVGAPIYFILIILAGSVNLKLNQIVRGLTDTESELRSMINVRPLLAELPLEYGGWAMNAQLAETVARLLLQNRPQFILECGSGSSTILLAKCLEVIGGKCRVISLDHEPQYANITRDFLARYELHHWAEVITTPLVPRLVNGEDRVWYGVNLESLPDLKIDMLIVDGPPSWDKPRARYPAVPILNDYLSDDCIIVLDDGDRPGEREAARCWANELGGNLEYQAGPRGIWILRRHARENFQSSFTASIGGNTA